MCVSYHSTFYFFFDRPSILLSIQKLWLTSNSRQSNLRTLNVRCCANSSISLKAHVPSERNNNRINHKHTSSMFLSLKCLKYPRFLFRWKLMQFVIIIIERIFSIFRQLQLFFSRPPHGVMLMFF